MNFLDNKYSKWYRNIINQASNRATNGYCEKHHILPKSLGGNNTKSNLVSLTAREHFICHWLLTKMTEGDARTKMIYALYRMRSGAPAKKMERYTTKITSKVYENLRGQLKVSDETKQKMRKPKSESHRANISKSRKGISFSEEHIANMSSSHKGKPSYTRSSETKEKNRAARIGMVLPTEWRQNISASHKGQVAWNQGKTMSDEWKAARPWHQCSKCGKKSQNLTVIKRYHNENCKCQ